MESFFSFFLIRFDRELWRSEEGRSILKTNLKSTLTLPFLEEKIV